MNASLASKSRPNRDQGIAYCDNIAMEMAEVAHIAYQDAKHVEKKMRDRGYEQFHYFECDDTEAFLIGNADKLVLIFRGTEPKSVQDWITNSQVAKVKACGGRVHAGFWRGCQDVWSSIEREVQNYRSGFAKAPPLLLTGHSLGGALAILAAAQFNLCGHQVNGIYTFGCPRIGDRHFAMQYNRKLYHCTYRLVNHRDIVAQLPPNELGYTHVGQLVYFDATGVRRISPFPQDDDFGWAESFYDHDMRAYKKSLKITQKALLAENTP